MCIVDSDAYISEWELSRQQGDYLGRGTAVRTAQDYGGNPRGMIGGNYGANRAEAELVAQYGGAGGGRSAGVSGGGAAYGGNQQASVYGGMSGGRGPGGILPVQSLSCVLTLCQSISLSIYPLYADKEVVRNQRTENLMRLGTGCSAGQMYGGHSAPAMGYGGVQLPPGRDYSAGRGTGGGGFPVQREGSYGGGRSDRPSIGSSRNDDRRDSLPPFRGGGDRSGGGDRGRHDDVNRRNNRDGDSRDRGRSNNSRIPMGGGRGPVGSVGSYDRDNRERGRDRDRDRRDDDRKRDRSPGVRAPHDRKLSPAADRDDRGRKESPRREASYR